MLEIDYPSKLGKLIASIDFDIELPIEWSDYFDQRGEVTPALEDERSNKRLKIRTHGVLWFDQSLPFCPRGEQHHGIYTRDFSRQGSGFLASFEIYPEETLRILLPTFWVKLRVVRARRITSKCYEIGTELQQRLDPCMEAFPESVLSAG